MGVLQDGERREREREWSSSYGPFVSRSQGQQHPLVAFAIMMAFLSLSLSTHSYSLRTKRRRNGKERKKGRNNEVVLTTYRKLSFEECLKTRLQIS